MIETSAVVSSTFAARSSRSRVPPSPTRTIRDRPPSSPSAFAAFSTAWCSIAVQTIPARGSFAFAATPRRAVLSDSLPLAVKTISAGSAPTSAATRARASSTAARARCPNQWRLEGLP